MDGWEVEISGGARPEQKDGRRLSVCRSGMRRDDEQESKKMNSGDTKIKAVLRYLPFPYLFLTG